MSTMAGLPLALLLATCATAQGERKDSGIGTPNIMLFSTDYLGYGNLQTTGRPECERTQP